MFRSIRRGRGRCPSSLSGRTSRFRCWGEGLEPRMVLDAGSWAGAAAGLMSNDVSAIGTSEPWQGPVQLSPSAEDDDVAPPALPTGWQPSPRIVGGQVSSPAAWPFMVSLQEPGFGHICGGTLIAPDVVLTAAHCISDDDGEPVQPASLRAVLGRHTLSTQTGEEIAIQSVQVHPNYDPETFDSDLGLIQLTRPASAPIQAYARPADAPLFAPGVNATVVGWGALFDGGPTVNQQRQITVPIISNQVANLRYDGAVTDNMLVAGREGGGGDSCHGDSGGPLLVPTTDNQYIVAGIVSWGVGCGEDGFPGVYTRVANFSQWIESYLTAGPDDWEPNDSAVSAIDLVLGDRQLTGLTIHQIGDNDWFRWTSSAAGTLTVRVGRAFVNGDIDVQLYSETGKWLAQASTLQDQEVITFSVPQAGQSYLIHTYGMTNVARATYDLTIDGPGTIVADSQESNNTRETARAISPGKSFTGNLHSNTDEDWYRWTPIFEYWGRYTFTYSEQLGPLTLELRTHDGELLGTQRTSRDQIIVEWHALPERDYYLRIYSPNGSVHPQYTVSLQSFIPVDVWEPNNSRPQALAVGGGDRQLAAATLHEVGDEDWYHWTALEDGLLTAQLNYDVRDGNLDLLLYDQDGVQLARLDGVENGPGQLQQFAAHGTSLYVLVKSSFGTAHFGYSLSLNVPYDIPPDPAEVNNSASAAHDLGSGLVERSGLTLPPGDEDWFRWDPATANAADIYLDFSTRLGNLELVAFEGAQPQEGSPMVGTVVPTDSGLQLHWQRTGNAAPLWLRVRPAAGSAPATYQLRITPQFPQDRFEPNDQAAGAFPVWTGAQNVSGLTLHSANDHDWIQWTADATGPWTWAVTSSGGGAIPSGLELEIYDQRQRLVGLLTESETVGQVTLTATQGVTYKLHLYSLSNTAVTDYGLLIQRGTSGQLLGDLTGDHQVTDADIDQLMLQIAQHSADARYDLNRDLIVDQLDQTYLVEEVLDTHLGDADLNGHVDSNDLLTIIGGWTGSMSSGSNPPQWKRGDFDGDGDTDSADLLLLLSGWTGAGNT